MGLKKPAGSTQSVSTASDSQPNSNRRSVDDQRRKARTLAKQQQASERIAGATVILTQGIGDALSARTQLNTAIEEIAAGAEEAAGAAQESLTAVTMIRDSVKLQLSNAGDSSKKTQSLQNLLDDIGSDIESLINGVSSASERQIASVSMMNELEQQAANINAAVKQVMRIADQTNLLALNAAIEAGRAGKHGKGFAVVADTVRTLAETSESNAGNIAELITEIQEKSRSVGEAIQSAADAALSEIEKGKLINEQLSTIKTDINDIYSGSIEIATGAQQMQTAVVDVQKGAEAISSAAEEQSSAAEEVMSTLEQQGQALNGAEQASQELEVQSEELKNSTDIAKSSEEVAAAAEELSTSVEEINRAASEIMTAITQISRGAEQAASASEQAAAGISQIEKSSAISANRATDALEKGGSITQLLTENKTSTGTMIVALGDAAEQGKSVLEGIQEIEQISRRIDKITDAIATVSIKTGMLAVNGAIEAARAGEFGKGFAVVSGDIQSLADDAAENIDQIKELVKAIQDQSILVMTDLSEVSTSSIQEVENAKVTTKNMDIVETDMVAIIDGNKEVLSASEEISTAVEQSKKAVEQIAAAAEQASSNASEASTAAEQQSSGAENLAVAIEDIASIADELQSV